MILSGYLIQKYNLVYPFNESQLNPNSYNMRLGPTIKMLNETIVVPNMEQRYVDFKLPYTLQPGELYLGHTIERSNPSTNFVPMIEGRSSFARLGLTVHLSAGFGDVGFRGQWTLEFTTVKPFVLEPGVEICQIFFVEVKQPVMDVYRGRYQNQEGAVGSRYHLPSGQDSVG